MRDINLMMIRLGLLLLIVLALGAVLGGRAGISALSSLGDQPAAAPFAGGADSEALQQAS